MSEVRIVDIPSEVRELYNADPELGQLRGELRSVGGKLGALIGHFKRRLSSLESERNELREQFRGRRAELVRQHGLAFASSEELNQKVGCRAHPKAETVWVPVGKLASAATGRGVEGMLLELWRYGLKCAECYFEGKTSQDEFAHDCPNCGIVLGTPQKFSDRATGRYAVYQDSHIYYHCRVCGVELGFVTTYGLSM